MTAPPPAQKRRLLLVDDEPVILRMFEVAFRRAGFEVDAFESATAARAMLNFRRYEALVTDKNMPDLDGLMLSESARRVDPGLPIVMTTGYATAESTEAILKVVDVLYSKPVSLTVLVSGVQSVIERRSSAAQEKAPAEAPITLVCGDPRLAYRIARVVRELGRPVEALGSLDELARLSAISGLLVDERLIGPEGTRTIWRLLGRYPDLKVVLIGEDAAFAVGLGAGARVSAGADDLTLKASLVQALRRDRARPAGTVHEGSRL